MQHCPSMQGRCQNVRQKARNAKDMKPQIIMDQIRLVTFFAPILMTQHQRSRKCPYPLTSERRKQERVLYVATFLNNFLIILRNTSEACLTAEWWRLILVWFRHDIPVMALAPSSVCLGLAGWQHPDMVERLIIDEAKAALDLRLQALAEPAALAMKHTG